MSSGLVAVAWMVADEGGDLEFNTINEFSCGRTEGTPLVRLSDAEAKLSECVTSYEKEVAGLTAELNAKDEEIERLERELQETKTIVGNQAERISDLEASPISEEVIDILRSKIKALESEILEQCRINGMGAEREATLLGKVERQSAALKLARGALEDCGRTYCTLIGNALMNEPGMFERSVVCKFVRGWFRNHKPVLAVKALAAIDNALGENNG